MAPLAEHLVGYLSMFLQLGVLALLAVLAVLVRTSLGRRPLDGWTAGLCSNAAALGILAVAAVGADARLLPTQPGATIAYAILEDLAALAFVAAIRRERGMRPVTVPLVALVAVCVALTAGAAVASPLFFGVYRVHSACFGLLLWLGAYTGVRMRGRRIGMRLVTVSLAALALDYLHVPLLSLLGVQFPTTYLGLESYVTMVLDIALGVAIVVHTTDGARVELEHRNAALAHAERALREAAYTDALCSIPNRAAFGADRSTARERNRRDDRCRQPRDGKQMRQVGGPAAFTAARTLRECCAAAGTVYRIGGDEFAGIWNDLNTDQVRAMLAATDGDLAVLGEDLRAPVRISWGVAAFGAHRTFADALIAADTRLYETRTVRSRLAELERG